MGASQILDRAIAAVSPRWALRRERARQATALYGAGYTGASISRNSLLGWRSRAADARSDINPDLPVLRARSRDLERNSPLACGAVGAQVTAVIGTGLTCQPQPDARALGISDAEAQEWSDTTVREWMLFAGSPECDITRTQDFNALQALAYHAVLASGDVFALLSASTRQSSPYRLALQLVEADRVCNPGTLPDTEKLSAGVECDDYGAPVAYHICTTHPGASLPAAWKWDRRDAFGADGNRQVLHLFHRRRPGQVRGVPMLAPVIEPIKQLQRYSEAELQAAVVSGTHAVFVRMDANAFGDVFSQEGQASYVSRAAAWDGSIPTTSLDGNGHVIQLMPGESIESSTPGRPNSAFDPFVQAILQQIGMALELPYEVLVKHFTASYSAARAALLDAWRFYRCRRDWFSSSFCQPVYDAWLREAVAIGRVRAPGFFHDAAVRRAWSSAIWIGDGPGSIDPLKEVESAMLRIDSGISTIAAESILHDGVDWRVKHRQRVIEQQAREAAGLVDPSEKDLPSPRGSAPTS